jgi:secondary thiamine-phosphate synthase enzyme
MFRRTLEFRTSRQGLLEITREVSRVVADSGIEAGMVNVFIQHTSASLCINENADPTVRSDLEAFLDRLVPEGADYFEHTIEGPDDMPSHIKCLLTALALDIPVEAGRPALGTWQGIYLWEHRRHPHRRKVVVTVW